MQLIILPSWAQCLGVLPALIPKHPSLVLFIFLSPYLTPFPSLCTCCPLGNRLLRLLTTSPMLLQNGHCLYVLFISANGSGSSCYLLFFKLSFVIRPVHVASCIFNLTSCCSLILHHVSHSILPFRFPQDGHLGCLWKPHPPKPKEPQKNSALNILWSCEKSLLHLYWQMEQQVMGRTLLTDNLPQRLLWSTLHKQHSHHLHISTQCQHLSVSSWVACLTDCICFLLLYNKLLHI
jgi:hypothetical protein